MYRLGTVTIEREGSVNQNIKIDQIAPTSPDGKGEYDFRIEGTSDFIVLAKDIVDALVDLHKKYNG
uniref:Uncharacterized protein n=1 Tax=viral metagenome TaxID=1070528 RepID=A0A6M3L4P3_9ZZZZ